MWIFLDGANGLMPSNAHWQHQSDQAFPAHELEHVDLILRLFHMKQEGRVAMLAIKLVNDIFLTREDNALRYFIANYHMTFQLGDFVFESGELRFFGLNYDAK